MNVFQPIKPPKPILQVLWLQSNGANFSIIMILL